MNPNHKNTSIPRRIRLLMISSIIGIVLAGLSFYYQRSNPALFDPIKLCTEHPETPCEDLVLRAGWPFPYVKDVIGSSVMGRIGIEDYFSPLNFFADIVFFTAVAYLMIRFALYLTFIPKFQNS